MIDLTQHPELIVRQEREIVEIFTSFETANRYSVLTPDGTQLLYAYEESGTFRRQFMGTHRPLSIHVIDDNSQPILEASRDFFWFLSHLYVSQAGRHIGTLNRQFALFSRKFTLSDSADRTIAQIDGSLLRYFTFIVKSAQGSELGRITKQWSGIGREAFTDADTFQIQFTDSGTDQDFRLLMLAAAFAIDLDFFEEKG